MGIVLLALVLLGASADTISHYKENKINKENVNSSIDTAEKQQPLHQTNSSNIVTAPTHIENNDLDSIEASSVNSL